MVYNFFDKKIESGVTSKRKGKLYQNSKKENCERKSLCEV